MVFEVFKELGVDLIVLRVALLRTRLLNGDARNLIRAI